MQGDKGMPNENFKNLVEIMFNQALGIMKTHNTSRGGSFPELFGSAGLQRDLKNISDSKPFLNPNIYVTAIKEFFNNDDKYIDKIPLLIERLESEGYIMGFDENDILNKCNERTAPIYKKILLDIWGFYYSNYLENDFKIYSIPQNDIDKITKRFAENPISVNLKFYQQRLPEILELLRTQNPNELYTNIKTEYMYVFKNVLEGKSFYFLSQEEKKVFFDTLYAVSDILDKVHHEDSYQINLEILSFLNEINDDDYENIGIEDIRKIQGCVYAIAIEDTEKSLQGNMKLTPHKNLTCIKKDYKPITREGKLDMCYQALKSLLSNTMLSKLNNYFKEEIIISPYERRLLSGGRRKISNDEIKNIYVLSLIYSNIAACKLQYIKHKINNFPKNAVKIELDEYHDKSRYLRDLIVRIVKKNYGETSLAYQRTVCVLADYYNTVATKYFYLEQYDYCIAIRSVLYCFYISLGLREKAYIQLRLTPISLYEQRKGNGQSYTKNTKSFFDKKKEYKIDFSHLTTERMTYDEFSQLVKRYQEQYVS